MNIILAENEFIWNNFPGHKGARDVTSYSKGEYEIVLPRDAQFKIVSKKDYSSHTEYEVEYE